MRDELTDAVIDLYRKITENSFQIDGEITDIVDSNLNQMLWIQYKQEQ